MVVLSPCRVSGVGVHKTYFRLPGKISQSPPFCYSADAFALPASGDEDDDEGDAQAPLGGSVSPNFLATQVWPSARAAASAIEQSSDPSWTICEFGCGPGLPSIVAAANRAATGRDGDDKASRASVIATDCDDFALQLVEAAARDQGLDSILSTQIFDLTCTESTLPEADLFVMSDVFECREVAVGAAKQTIRALDLGKRVWIFAQNDRAQRDLYWDHLNELLQKNRRVTVEWTEMVQDFPLDDSLILFDVDEKKVEYC